jgi:predicted metal-binding membrane protein
MQPATTTSSGDTHLAAPAIGAVVVTIGLGTVGWVVTLQRMSGMDMGVATRLGSLLGFLSLWVPMMAAMMLPGTSTSVLRLLRSTRRALDVPGYVGSYLAVWVLFGIVVYALYRPHAALAAGAFTLAAGCYELTPIKRHFRRMGQHRVGSGVKLGLCCVGSTIGLMLMMVALGVMSLTWMAVTAAVVLVQKLLPPRTAIDVPVALAIVALGVAVLVAPASVPGLVPPMHPMPM